MYRTQKTMEEKLKGKFHFPLFGNYIETLWKVMKFKKYIYQTIKINIK